MWNWAESTSTARVDKREEEKCPRCPTMPHQGTTELLKLSACEVYTQGHAAGPLRLSRAPDRTKTMPLPCSRHVNSGGPSEDWRPQARVESLHENVRNLTVPTESSWSVPVRRVCSHVRGQPNSEEVEEPEKKPVVAEVVVIEEGANCSGSSIVQTWDVGLSWRL